MAARVLVCLDDTAVAHVIAARLMRDGLEGVVVGAAARLADESRKGAAAVCVQHRYATGEVGSSLLRQVRVARGEVVPSTLVMTADVSGPDRLVYERQYKVGSFLPASASPGEIADAIRACAGVEPPRRDNSEEDLVLHEDEEKNEFDIHVDSQANVLLEAAFAGAFDDDDDDDDITVKTAEISRAELMRLNQGAAPGATEEGADFAARTVNGVDDSGDLSQLPAPGGDDDFDIHQNPTVAVEAPAPPATTKAAVDAQVTRPTEPTVPKPEAQAPAAAAEGDRMQIQELQRTQAELKKALLAERKAREAAQKRAEELEQKLAKMGDEPTSAGQGVPAEGVFEDLRYPALLARCRSEAFTGSMVMQSGGTTRTVFMKDGLPVGYSSSEPGQRIGKVLVSQGRITDEQYMKAATRMVERSIQLTDALVELGLIDAESLAVEQRNLTRDQIIAGFELVQGRFTTSNGATPDANTPVFDFGPGEIYVQGYRRYAPANEMAAAYETLRDKYLTTNARLASYRPKLGLTSDDERLLRLLGEALTVEEAVERAGLSPEAAARLLSAMQALDLVEEWSPGVEQFRSRLRAERQRHAEAIAALEAEHRSVQDRLLRAFEAALAGAAGAGGALASTLAEARASGGSSSSSSPTAQSSTASSSTASSSTASSGGTPSTSSSTSSTPRAVSERFDGGGEPARADARIRSETGKEARDAKDARPERSTLSWESSGASLSSSSSSSSMPSAGGAVDPARATSTSTPRADSKPLSSLSSTLQSAKDGEGSPAEKKYREGIEQAAQERLDEAEVTLREAVRLDATRPEYLAALARVLLANPRYERSGTLPVVRSLLDRAVAISPDHPEASALHKQVVDEMKA